MIEITIPGPPLPWKAPYVGTRGSFSPRYEVSKIIKRLIQDQYEGEIVDVAICCDFTFYMPIPKATSKKRRVLMVSGEVRPVGTPDRSNCVKFYEDLLQGIVIKNDSKIVDGRSEKYYGEIPRTEIHISTI